MNPPNLVPCVASSFLISAAIPTVEGNSVRSPLLSLVSIEAPPPHGMFYRKFANLDVALYCLGTGACSVFQNYSHDLFVFLINSVPDQLADIKKRNGIIRPASAMEKYVVLFNLSVV